MGKAGELDTVARRAGVRVTKDEHARLAQAIPDRPRVLYSNDRRSFWARGNEAAARIYRIMQGCSGSSDMNRAVENAEERKLAKVYAETWIYYMTRKKAPPTKGTDHNPFRWLSDEDAERLFMRKVEDICDRSTGRLGSWWTPK